FQPVRKVMKMEKLPCCIHTGVGSMPHDDPGYTVDLIIKEVPYAPFWPQLPARDFREEMYYQYSEKFPCWVLDVESKKGYFRDDEDLYQDLANFHEKFLSDEPEDLPISAEYASGLAEYLSRKDEISSMKPRFVKGQITGPISMGLYLTVNRDKPVLYHPELYEAMCTALLANIRWMAKQLKKMGGRDVLIFVDEPYLASYGSGVIHMPEEIVNRSLKEFVDEVKSTGAVSGIHCCGNTDWSVVLRSGVEVINFDAYEYGENFLLYRNDVANFIKEGGVLAWGIVPTLPKAEILPAEEIAGQVEGMADRISPEISIKNVLEHSMITPSCGMGALPVKKGEKILRTTREVSEYLRKKYEMNTN
ncbi:MAG: hypothetical protein J7M18_07900, partial [Candidatus Eremiobacteraeota bacterium]|nr:hypothetical protein [Candidatus Eremiobacteraeota bacterium]